MSNHAHPTGDHEHPAPGQLRWRYHSGGGCVLEQFVVTRTELAFGGWGCIYEGEWRQVPLCSMPEPDGAVVPTGHTVVVSNTPHPGFGTARMLDNTQPEEPRDD